VHPRDNPGYAYDVCYVNKEQRRPCEIWELVFISDSLTILQNLTWTVLDFYAFYMMPKIALIQQMLRRYCGRV